MSPQSLSAIETLPAEVLQIVFLSCPNLDFPLASPIIGAKLSSPYVYDSLSSIAFRRCEADYNFTPCFEYYDRLYCPICPSSDSKKPQMVPTQEEHANGLSLELVGQPCGTCSSKSGSGEKIRHDPLALCLPDKRRLQNWVMGRPWFSIRHVLKIEEDCTACSDELVSAFRSAQPEVTIHEEPGEVFWRSWGTDHHFKHSLHGVGLPSSLLQSLQSDDELKMLTKLIEWQGFTECWTEQACVAVREKALVDAYEGVKKAYADGRINSVKPLLSDRERDNEAGIALGVPWDTWKVELDNGQQIQGTRIMDDQDYKEILTRWIALQMLKGDTEFDIWG